MTGAQTHSTYSIVIPCYNEERYIGKCLDSLIQLDWPKDQLEVWVADGGSKDGTRKILDEFAAQHDFIHWVDNPQQFTPYALNLGIKKSSADRIMILGAHATLDSQFLKESEIAFQKDDRIGCVGGLLENVYENEVSRAVGIGVSSPFGVGNAHFRTGKKEGKVDTVAFGVYKKEVFDKVGYFHEELTRNQDDEFNFRVTQAGFLIWLSSSMKAQYFVRASYSRLWRQYYQYGYWKVYVNKLHQTVTTVRQLVPALFVLYLFSWILAPLLPGVLIGAQILALILYLLLGITTSFARSASILQGFRVWWVVLLLHLSYGLGYLRGIWDFLLMGKKPVKSMEKTSR
ncbi:glycosyltransferase family 2 protein [bacterium SCSIO 12741]|nr:glycosyltransferase family 2 protein [bacterium SCSIO 12741]